MVVVSGLSCPVCGSEGNIYGDTFKTLRALLLHIVVKADSEDASSAPHRQWVWDRLIPMLEGGEEHDRATHGESGST